MEAKPFETKYDGIRIIYQREGLLRVNIIPKENLFAPFVTYEVFHSAIPTALLMSTSSFFSPVMSDHQSL